MASVVMDIIARDHFSQQFIKAGSEAEALSKKVSTTGSKIGSAMKVGAAVGVAALVTIATASVELASKFEDSQKRLETALEASGSSFDKLKGPIAAADKQMEKLGFTNTQTADALANLTVATKNPTKSLNLLGVAADLARFKHIDLAEAATAVGKAMAGNLKPIKALGIDLPVAAGGAVKVAAATKAVAAAQVAYNQTLATYQQDVGPKSAELTLRLRIAQDKYTAAQAAYNKLPTVANLDKVRSAVINLHSAQDKLDQAGNYSKVKAAADKLKEAQQKLNTTQQSGATILKVLSERLGGQAQAAASTLAGKTEVLKARFEDMGIKLGSVLIPKLITLVTWVSNVTTWFQKHTTVTKVLAGILGGLLVASILRVTAAWVAANIAFVATPIGAVITGLIALVAALVLLWKHWDQIWGWISHHRAYAILIAVLLSILLPVALLVTAVVALLKHWDTAWATMVNIIRTAERLILVGVKAIVDVFLSMVSTILHGAAAAFGWIPGLGGKLKTARDAFDVFKQGVDRNFQDMINATSGAQRQLNSLQGTISGLHGTTVTVKLVYDTTSVGGGGTAIGGRAVSGAAGGRVTGPGTGVSDNVPAWLSNGEFVMRAAAVGKYGVGFMENLNAQKFAAGGPINVVLPPNGTVVGRLSSIENSLRPTVRAPALSAGIAGAPGVAVSGNISALQAYAYSLFPAYGWGRGELGSLIALWNGESGWNPAAYNASSGATGIPQSLPASKMASAGADYLTNGATQIRWGESYIASVYGSPSAAYGAWLSRSPHWYGAGMPPTLFNRPTLIGVGEHGPETVSVTPGRGGAGGGASVIVNVYAAQGMSAEQIGRQVAVQVRSVFDDRDRRAAKGGRA